MLEMPIAMSATEALVENNIVVSDMQTSGRFFFASTGTGHISLDNSVTLRSVPSCATLGVKAGGAAPVLGHGGRHRGAVVARIHNRFGRCAV
jgi:hypothetical protein